jgi:hypothetical protein
MSNKNMTAVEWLVDQLKKWEIYSKISFQCLKEIEEAKAMEKEQMNQLHINCTNGTKTFEQYYKETYEK